MPIIYVMLYGGPRLNRWLLFAVVSVPFVAISVVALVLSITRYWSARGKPVDELAADRRMATLVLLFDCTIATVALNQGAADSPALGLVILAAAVVWTIFWLSPSRRTAVTTTTVVIDDDPAIVFAFVADDVNLPRYISMIVAVEKISSGPIGPGTRFRRHEIAGKQKLEGVSEVIDFERNKLVSSRLISRSSESLILTSEVMTMEPGPTGTVLHHQLKAETTYNSALVGLALLLTLMKSTLVSRYTVGLGKLKQILESDEFDR